jgi:hypothetical protein
MNNVHNLRDAAGRLTLPRPTKSPLSELRSRPESLSAALPASRQHTPQRTRFQPLGRKTTDQFLINGRIIRNYRKPLKTNNRTLF